MEQRDDLLDLRKIVSIFRSRLVMIVLIAALTTVMAASATVLLVTPTYSSTAKIYIENKDPASVALNLNEINTAQKLTETCLIIFKSDEVLIKVIDQLALDYSIVQLSKMITILSVNDTPVMNITVISEISEEAAEIANTLIQVGSEQFQNIVKSGVVEIVDVAKVSASPNSSQLKRNIILGFITGLCISILIIVLNEYFDTKVKSDDDLPDLYGIPVLAEIPERFVSLNGNRRKKARYYRNKKKLNLVIDEQTEFAVVEAYKMAKPNMMFALSTTEKKTLVMTSSASAEGKSTACVNLGIVLAQLGAKVLIIDGDLRRPNIHNLLNLNFRNGLTSFLCKQCSLQDAVLQQVRPGLDVIPIGQIPPNPGELLGSDRMQQMLLYLENFYQYILIDTPPIGVVSDALMLSENIAGYLYIVQEKSTTHSDIKQGIEKINLAKGEFLGFVKVECGVKAGRYGQYNKNYTYGYGG